MAKPPLTHETILYLAALLGACACSSGGAETSGAGGATVLGAGGLGGGTPSGGAPVGGNGGVSGQGVAGTLVGAGGAPAVPAGQLMCGGKLCHAGGHCATDGSCPAFLGTCFSNADKFETCGSYCSSLNVQCAAKSCNSDGSPITGGYSWVSYPASGRASCGMNGVPATNSFDECVSPIWLSPQKPLDDVIRCCCKG